MTVTETTHQITAQVSYAFARKHSDYGSPSLDVVIEEVGRGWCVIAHNKGDLECYEAFDSTPDLITWLQSPEVLTWHLDDEQVSIGELLAVI
ncbi:hypothetical protein HOS75_gp029 [Gordonia phage SteveFrench]|uniref:Uncharacterized protein n=2 Tax=Montyvirus stevefrench TaxID=2734258 RepID=A0A890V2I4_9CAUD|nr:hypothetical protein HOS75_gp029 [Gordonia phage SteveFrench]AUV60701.1 hypothetical protein SEA_STEVEFRENCH_99 [Gordonia phage SteveFrench]QRI45684.1 hypothetical protein SEA_ROYALG_100 [Gordonia phage RoyalG]